MTILLAWEIWKHHNAALSTILALLRSLFSVARTVKDGALVYVLWPGHLAFRLCSRDAAFARECIICFRMFGSWVCFRGA